MSFAIPNSLVSQPGGSFTGSLNPILGSFSNSRLQEPHKIGYPDGWRTGATEKWYDEQPAKTFTHLQYWKEREPPFYHEYIVVRLEGQKSVCRFDRRGDVSTRANAFTFEGITAEDTAHVIQTTEDHYHQIGKTSDKLLEIHFPAGQDLLTILGICYGVQKDDATRAYTLTRYNCYFLCWIIITGTARRTVDWALLGRDEKKWEELVQSTIENLKSNPSAMSQLKAGARSLIGRDKNALVAPETNPIPFIGMTYFISMLRKALFNTRADIQTKLGHLILKKTVDESVRRIAHESTEKAAQDAAIIHAAHAARDAAMEAVIEATWRSILASDHGGQLWEDLSKAAEDVAWKAATAAANSYFHLAPVDETSAPVTADWEQAWNTAWTEGWKVKLSERGKNNDSIGRSDRETISARAKDAWFNAWTEACQASESYVPLISDGVSTYVEKNLPDSLPEVLKIDLETRSKIKSLLAAMGPDKTNSQLQVYVENRINEHCVRIRNIGVIQNPTEIEEAMGRVWVKAVGALDATVN